GEGPGGGAPEAARVARQRSGLAAPGRVDRSGARRVEEPDAVPDRLRPRLRDQGRDAQGARRRVRRAPRGAGVLGKERDWTRRFECWSPRRVSTGTTAAPKWWRLRFVTRASKSSTRGCTRRPSRWSRPPSRKTWT